MRLTGGQDGLYASGFGSSDPVNVTVKDVESIGNRFDGLEFRGVDDVEIIDTHVSGNQLSTGIEIVGAANVRLRNVEAVNGGATGIAVVNASTAEMRNVIADGNNIYGIDSINVGEVGMRDLSASDNGNIGLRFDGVSTIGLDAITANQNGSDGIFVTSSGDVSLKNVEALGNFFDGIDINKMVASYNNADALVDITGAGVRFADSNDSDPSAIGGNLSVIGSQFDGNRTGLYSSDRIDGSVSITNVSASENELDGIRFQDRRLAANSIGGSLSVTNVDLVGNERYGLLVQHSVAGSITLRNVVAASNGFSANDLLAPGSGAVLIGADGVVIRGGQYNDNEADGIFVFDADSVLLTGVEAEGNGEFDLETIGSGEPTIRGNGVEDISVTP